MKLFKWGLLAISLIITHPTWIQIIIIQAMATNNLKIIMLQGKIRSKLGLNITNSKWWMEELMDYIIKWCKIMDQKEV